MRSLSAVVCQTASSLTDGSGFFGTSATSGRTSKNPSHGSNVPQGHVLITDGSGFFGTSATSGRTSKNPSHGSNVPQGHVLMTVRPRNDERAPDARYSARVRLERGPRPEPILFLLVPEAEHEKLHWTRRTVSQEGRSHRPIVRVHRCS